MIRTLFILATCVFLTCFSSAQKVDPKYSFNIEAALPGTIVNKPFNDIMQGLANVNLYGQYSFPFHLNLALGLKYSLFTINEFAVPEARDGNMQIGTAYLKVGWDKFHNDRFGTDIGVKFGYSENFFVSYNPHVPKDDAEYNYKFKRIGSVNIETTIGLILTATERSSYRLVLGHGISGFGYHPDMIGISSLEGYDPAQFDKLTQYFLVGFGYTYYFGQRSAGD